MYKILERKDIENYLSIIKVGQPHDMYVVRLHVFEEDREIKAGIYCYNIKEYYKRVDQAREVTDISNSNITLQDIEKAAVYSTAVTKDEVTITREFVMNEKDGIKIMINNLFTMYISTHIGNHITHIIGYKPRANDNRSK